MKETERGLSTLSLGKWSCVSGWTFGSNEMNGGWCTAEVAKRDVCLSLSGGRETDVPLVQLWFVVASREPGREVGKERYCLRKGFDLGSRVSRYARIVPV